jgi:hypothetical protein
MAMSAKNLTLLVVGYDEANMRRFDLTHCGAAETHLVINYQKLALGTLGNLFLNSAIILGNNIFGICHADSYFGPGALDKFAEVAGEGAVCGLVGFSLAAVQEEHKGYVWSRLNPQPVDTLDSASCFFPISSGLRFDAQTFDGFHCHVEDLCLQAHALDIPVVVPPADASHGGGPNQDWLDQWHEDYRGYKAKLLGKWPNVRFGTT